MPVTASDKLYSYAWQEIALGVNTDFPLNFNSLTEPYSGRAPLITRTTAPPRFYMVKTTTNPPAHPPTMFSHMSVYLLRKALRTQRLPNPFIFHLT